MYIKPSDTELEEMRNIHLLEKKMLRNLELLVSYRINNPELTKQRDRVRRIKDKIIMAEAFDQYPILSKKECAFNVSEYCNIKINHSFYHWLIYGNCCQECSRIINNISTKFVEEEIEYIPKYSAWDELSTLDSQDIDVYLD